MLNHPFFVAGLQKHKIYGHRRKNKNKWLSGNLFDKAANGFRGRPIFFRYNESEKFEVKDAKTDLLIPGITSYTGIIAEFPGNIIESICFTIKVMVGSLSFFGYGQFPGLDIDYLKKLLVSKTIYKSDANAGSTGVRFENSSLVVEDQSRSKSLNETFLSICPSDGSLIFCTIRNAHFHFSVACRGLHIGSISAPLTESERFSSSYSGDVIILRRKSIETYSLWNYMRAHSGQEEKNEN